ncbi:MAG: sel1 repeat family protein [Prevotella sp.]|nr:sel1 repeat family protein [Prevotella sp.]
MKRTCVLMVFAMLCYVANAQVEYSKQLAKDAKNGNAEAQYRLAECYYKGLGTKVDKEKALMWYEQAANGFMPEVQKTLAGIYLQGDEDVAQNVEKALELYNRLILMQDTATMMLLAHIYEDGKFVKRDYQKALSYYEKAAEARNVEAMYQIATYYHDGKGMRADLKKANAWYQRAADLKQTDAMAALGNAYQFGYGVAIDEEKALPLLKDAAYAGSLPAISSLSAYYYNIGDTVRQQIWDEKLKLAMSNKSVSVPGVDIPTAEDLEIAEQVAAAQYAMGTYYLYEKSDTIKAIYWLERAADNGYTEAQERLGYLTGQETWLVMAAKQDYVPAMSYLGSTLGQDTWRNKAAEMGDVVSICNLAREYLDNEDYKNAFKWYQLDAKKGETECLYELGRCYLTGRGTARNEAEGLKLLLQAADRHYAEAFIMLGMHYYYDDKERGKQYMRRAAEEDFGVQVIKDDGTWVPMKGNQEAQWNLALWAQMEKDDTEAAKWMEKVVAWGSGDEKYVEALYDLGGLYGGGSGVSKDSGKAQELWRKAFEEAQHWSYIPSVMHLIGEMYFYGKGTEQNQTKAVECFANAADGGYCPSIFCLGDCYAKGIGVKKDTGLANYLYQAAQECINNH